MKDVGLIIRSILDDRDDLRVLDHFLRHSHHRIVDFLSDDLQVELHLRLYIESQELSHIIVLKEFKHIGSQKIASEQLSDLCFQ